VMQWSQRTSGVTSTPMHTEKKWHDTKDKEGY